MPPQVSPGLITGLGREQTSPRSAEAQIVTKRIRQR